MEDLVQRHGTLFSAELLEGEWVQQHRAGRLLEVMNDCNALCRIDALKLCVCEEVAGNVSEARIFCESRCGVEEDEDGVFLERHPVEDVVRRLLSASSDVP